jgi:hypothetical protein
MKLMKRLILLLLFPASLFGGVLTDTLVATTGGSIPKAHIMVSNTNTLTSGGATNLNLIPWTNIDAVCNSCGPWSTNGTKLYFPTNGAYLGIMSLIMRTGVNEGGNARIWLRQNGTNVINSGTHVDFPTVTLAGSITNFSQVVTVPFDIQVASGDYIEIAWWSDVAGIVLPSYPVGTNPARPVSPCLIMTVHKTSSQ